MKAKKSSKKAAKSRAKIKDLKPRKNPKAGQGAAVSKTNFGLRAMKTIPPVPNPN